MERGKEYTACFSCPEFAKCNTGQNLHCLYNYSTTQGKLRKQTTDNERVSE